MKIDPTTETTQITLKKPDTPAIDGRTENGLWVAGFILFGLIFAVMLTISRHKTKKKYLSMNREWYKATHPENVRWDEGHGRIKRIRQIVSCSQCGSEKIGQERLMQGWHMRRHFCQQCGHTLYYSKE